jgi:hypothetical protein
MLAAEQRMDKKIKPLYPFFKFFCFDDITYKNAVKQKEDNKCDI